MEVEVGMLTILDFTFLKVIGLLSEVGFFIGVDRPGEQAEGRDQRNNC